MQTITTHRSFKLLLSLTASAACLFNVTSLALPSPAAGGKSTAGEPQELAAVLDSIHRVIKALPPGETCRTVPGAAHFQAFNPAQKLKAWFRKDGVWIHSSRGNEWSATFRYGSHETVPVARENRVDYHHADGVTEWYINQPDGIEHGFTVRRRLAAAGDGLQIQFGLDGVIARTEPRAAGSAGSPAIEFFDPVSGTAVLRYDKLQVNDATGRELPAELAPTAAGIVIKVNDADAVYPVTIDPLITSQEAKLLPLANGDGAANDLFGRSLAVDSNTAVIGVPGDDIDPAANVGSVYVFVRNAGNWSLQAKLLANDKSSNDEFASSVAVSGDTLVVGSPNDNHAGGSDAGSAYVFVRTGTNWSQQAKLTAGDPAASDFFGRAVAVDGDTAVIGASGDNTTATDTGSAYVFVRTGATWSQQQKLEAADAAAFNSMGTAVAVLGNTALIGAPSGDVGGGTNDTGCVYVFQRSGTVWTEMTKLLATDIAVTDFFGSAISLAGTTALIGAPFKNLGPASFAGAAYLFTGSGAVWSQTAKLLASDAAASDLFGSSVATTGTRSAVGAPGDNSGTGSAYLFTGASETAKLVGTNVAAGAQLGAAVAVSGNTTLVGAFNDYTLAGAMAGTTYVFDGATIQARLTAGDGADFDLLGWSVALSGDTALVGVRGDDTAAGATAGSAYAFVRTGGNWSLQQILLAADATAGSEFGTSVGLDGDTAIIGAPRSSGQTGSAYVFTRSSGVWAQQAKLVGSDSAGNDWFGYSVAVSSNTTVVGAYLNDTAGGADAGGAYVFVRTGTVWSEQAKLTASDGAAADRFGTSVSIDRETAVVGSALDDHAGGTDAGSAYVYTRTGVAWSEQGKLLATDAAANDQFGASVTISSNSVIVGAYLDDTVAGSDAGGAYVFVRSGSIWTQQAKLTPADAAAGDRFGSAVALQGDLAAVGSTWDDTTAGMDTGSAYLFSRSGTAWSQQAKLEGADALGFESLGHSIALSADTVLAGAPVDYTLNALTGDTRIQHGSAYVFRIAPNAPVFNVASGIGFTNSLFSFVFTAPPGATVVLQASTNLSVWTPLQTNVMSGPVLFSDPASSSAPLRYYRAVMIVP